MPVHQSTNTDTVYLVFVDDTIIGASNEQLLIETKALLSERFNMKDVSELKNFLGIQFERVGDSISMSQKDYIRKILSKIDMADCKLRGM